MSVGVGAVARGMNGIVGTSHSTSATHFTSFSPSPFSSPQHRPSTPSQISLPTSPHPSLSYSRPPTPRTPTIPTPTPNTTTISPLSIPVSTPPAPLRGRPRGQGKGGWRGYGGLTVGQIIDLFGVAFTDARLVVGCSCGCV